MARAKQTARPAAKKEGKSRRSMQSKADLHLAVSRVKQQIRRLVLNKTRVSDKVAVSLAATIEKLLFVFLDNALTYMSDKEKAKAVKVFGPAHFAAALNDPEAKTYGVFDKHVAGIFIKQ